MTSSYLTPVDWLRLSRIQSNLFSKETLPFSLSSRELNMLLCLAASAGNPLAPILVELGADIRSHLFLLPSDRQRRFFPVALQHLDPLSLALESYAETRHFFSSRENFEAVIRDLLRLGANLDVSSSSPLSLVLTAGASPSLISSLLEFGANFSSPDENDYFPLDFAFSRALLPQATILVDAGASLTPYVASCRWARSAHFPDDPDWVPLLYRLGMSAERFVIPNFIVETFLERCGKHQMSASFRAVREQASLSRVALSSRAPSDEETPLPISRRRKL